MVNIKSWIIFWRFRAKTCYLQSLKICLGRQPYQWTNKANLQNCRYYHMLWWIWRHS